MVLIWVHINTYDLLWLAQESKSLQTALHSKAALLFQPREVPMDTEDGGVSWRYLL